MSIARAIRLYRATVRSARLSAAGSTARPRSRAKFWSPGRARLVLLVSAALALAVATPGSGQEIATFSNLYSFTSTVGYSDPSNLVLGNDGNFYGVTSGDPGRGATIYQLTPSGVVTTFHTFHSKEGWSPLAALVLGTDGNFYGTTSTGGMTPAGESGHGTVYRITPAGVFKTLHVFTPPDGSYPANPLVEGSDEAFYGTTSLHAGVSSATIFRITRFGDFKVLHVLGDREGSDPSGALVEGSDGNLYGTTSGGGDYGNGTLYRVSHTGRFVLLHSFSASEGTSPSGLTLGTDGSLYGTTSTGTIFRSTLAGELTILPTAVNRGAGVLTLGRDGNFYGVTSSVSNPAASTAYQLTPAGAVTILHVFSYEDGELPLGQVEGPDGNYYGVAALGGSNNFGTLFKLTPGTSPAHPGFFDGQVALGNGAYYLTLPDGTSFGYYSYLDDPGYIYHYSLGYEYVLDAADGSDGIYLYDFISGDWLYTSPVFPYPYFYDFQQQSVVFYEGDTLGRRFFYVFRTGQTIASFLLPTNPIPPAPPPPH